MMVPCFQFGGHFTGSSQKVEAAKITKVLCSGERAVRTCPREQITLGLQEAHAHRLAPRSQNSDERLFFEQ